MPLRRTNPAAIVSALSTGRLVAFTILVLSTVLVGAVLLSDRGPSSHHVAGSVAVVRSADRSRGVTTGARSEAPGTRRSMTQSADLSLQQLAGQRIVYAYAGRQPPSSLLSAIRAGEAGGVIFFANNISSPRQLRTVITKLQQASVASPVHARLLMLTDQEGGQVRRLPGAPVLSEKQIGQAANASALARAAGAGAGQNLRGVGINVNLAPVLDVYRRPGNFIDQFGRSYSGDPAQVAALGAMFIRA